MLYEVDVFQGLFNQSCINTFNYMSTGTPAVVTGSYALMNAMGLQPLPGTPTVFIDGSLGDYWQALVSTALTFLSVQVKAIYDPTDFYELPFPNPITGRVGGECNSPFMSFGLRSSIVNRDIGRGYKRFAGVPETSVGTGGIVTTATINDLFTPLANLMGDALTYTDEGNSLTFTPCVVSKEKYHPEGKTTWAYRYYSTLTLQTPHVAQGVKWSPYSTVRSQTSRQYGKGV